jgi:hypothetical protein
MPSFGLLHRIPPPAAHLKEGRLPPDMLDDEADDGAGLFVPADLSGARPESLRSPPGPGRAGSPLRAPTPTRAFPGESAVPVRA